MLFVGQFYGNAVILAVYAVLLAVIAKKQPYKGERKNYRPIANCLIVVAV